MIRVNKTFVKSNPNTTLWFDTPAGTSFKDYRVSTYGSKLSNSASGTSNDGRTFTYSVTWTSRADYDAMMADPVVQQAMSARKAYHAQNGVSETESQIVNL
jgi:hypothetical protein